MKLTAWRLVKTRYAGTAFDGEGARRYGGRWNSPGTLVAYAAGTASLAVLEVLVHVELGAVLPSYSLIAVEFDDAYMEMLRPTALPEDWWVSPPSGATQSIGDRWIQEGRSAVLCVPSTVIGTERNYLFNVAHPDFSHVRVGKPEPFVFDARLLRGA
jgi:RES domain-containing protein